MFKLENCDTNLICNNFGTLSYNKVCLPSSMEKNTLTKHKAKNSALEFLFEHGSIFPKIEVMI